MTQMCRNASRRQRADVEKLGSAELIAFEDGEVTVIGDKPAQNARRNMPNRRTGDNTSGSI
jgi:hypothetical protein